MFLKQINYTIFSVKKYRYKLKANLIQNFAQDTDAWKTISSLLDMVAIFSFYGGTANGIDT